MSMDEARLWELIERAARAVTDPDTGKFTDKELIDELRRLLSSDDLPPHVEALTKETMAKALAERFVRRRRPKLRKQGALFHPESVLPLGNGERVWMDRAVDSDLIDWARQSSQNLSRVAKAESERQGYVASRLGAMRDHPGATLGWVERREFGYVDDDDLPDVDDDDPESATS